MVPSLRLLVISPREAGIAAARANRRIGGRRQKFDAVKRREIIESVITGRKSGANMARLYNINQPTVSRVIAITGKVSWWLASSIS